MATGQLDADRILDSVVLSLGPANAYTLGRIDSTGEIALHRRKKMAERPKGPDGKPTDDLFQLLGKMTEREMGQIIAQSLDEPDAVRRLIVRFTEGRDVLKELNPNLQALVQQCVKDGVASELRRLREEAQVALEKAKAELAAARAEPRRTPDVVKEEVAAQLSQPDPTAPADPEYELVAWAKDNNYGITFDKRRGREGRVTKGWIEKMTAVRAQYEAERRDIAVDRARD